MAKLPDLTEQDVASLRKVPAALLLFARAFKPKGALEGSKIAVSALGKPPPKKLAWYAKRKSSWLSADDIRTRLTDNVLRWLAYALWFLDFKWVTGNTQTGFGTQVHFGRVKAPDSRGFDKARFVLDRGAVLHYKEGKRTSCARLAGIEVPIDPHSHIGVRVGGSPCSPGPN